MSELVQFKIEHVAVGYFDLYTKGGKIRRIFIPNSLRVEAMVWLDSQHRSTGYLLEKFNDLSLLADLMGHESIETTRIYLRRTSTEQQAIVDKIVTW